MTLAPDGVPVARRPRGAAAQRLTSRSATSHRLSSFETAQGLGGLIGVLVAAGFIVWVGWPDLIEAIALTWLVVPLALAIAANRAPRSPWPQALSVLSVNGLTIFVAAFSGGALSPFALWLVLAPFEAALRRHRAMVWLAMGSAALGYAGLLALSALDALPPSRLTPAFAEILFAALPLLAILYAGAAALSADRAYRAAARAAEEGAAHYRLLAENAGDMITRHRADGRIVFVSAAARALTGYAPEDLIGRAPGDLVHGEDLAKMETAFAEASYRGRDAAAEIRLKRADGEYAWVDLRCRPTREGGEAGAIVAVTRDIAERKRHDAELKAACDAAEAANRAKSRFLANMSHELRTPLNAIIGFSDMMRQGMFGPIGHAKYEEYAGLIHGSGEHLLALISDILDMSKVEAGKYELQKERVDLGALIAETLTIMRVGAEQRKIRLRTEWPDAPPALEADRRALKQILLNLLSNAVKFTPEGGRVTVSVARSENGLRLTVSDTGRGIPAEALSRLGAAFEQVAGAYTSGQPGTGLGLAIVKALTGLHGGTMTIESELGRGTRVTIALPAACILPPEHAPEGESNIHYLEPRRASA
ncbi:MAG: PAS domain S-box protein [Alphaproteobacteria bacterium]|nr:PAS domain S-box protein [Alphaproteobacteria bacterium]